MSDRLKITELDFDSIKQNLKNFLKQQSEFEDYDFEGSGINILLDLLAYNTHYNAYYLNMIANESFLNSSILRNSVVAHAKKFGYMPKSKRASKATVNIVVNGNSFANSTLVLPKEFTLRSQSIDQASYDFITLDEKIATKNVSNYFNFTNVDIYQGSLETFSYAYNEQTNPKQIFEIPDPNVDTTKIKVSVQKSISNTFTTVYAKAEDVLQINSESEVYFIQESQSGNYEIYFGDGVLGKKIPNGSIVRIQYLITDGEAANKANNFTSPDSISGLYSYSIFPSKLATGGSEKETIDEIKYSAPLQLLTQKRAVTKSDYIKLILEKYADFESVNVWGGEENNPPVYGKVFVSAKPKLGFELTNVEKDLVTQEILKPISILTVKPEIIDVDYNYLKIDSRVYYNPISTALTESDLKTNITSLINNFCNEQLNKFDSLFKTSSLMTKIDSFNQSIISNEIDLFVFKKFRPDLINSRSYVLDFGFPLKRGEKETNFYSNPKFSMIDDQTGTIRECFFEELPSSFSGIESISITNPGVFYTEIPTVEIVGDGSGATAEAVLLNGRIKEIKVTNSGVGYTSAIVKITNNPRDTTGRLAEAEAVTENRYGKIRISYYKPEATTNKNVKYVLNESINEGIVGTIDYVEGKISIENFNPVDIGNNFKSISLYIRPKSSIIKSQFNKMLVLDSTDSTSVNVNLIRN